ncbi:hypothetical protein ACX3U9_01770 [Corynebacterium pyruviciproducens]
MLKNAVLVFTWLYATIGAALIVFAHAAALSVDKRGNQGGDMRDIGRKRRKAGSSGATGPVGREGRTGASLTW